MTEDREYEVKALGGQSHLRLENVVERHMKEVAKEDADLMYRIIVSGQLANQAHRGDISDEVSYNDRAVISPSIG